MASVRLGARTRDPLIFAVLAAALLLVACAPGPDIDPAQHQTYLVYDWDPDSRSYELHPSRIETLTDPRALAGTVAELRGAGSLAVRNADPQTKSEYAEAIEVRKDETPRVEYYLDGDVVVPYDFDSQMMVTLYHHLERADRYFTALGVEPVGRLPVHYFPLVSVFGLPIPLLADNAAYAMTLDAFLIPPTIRLDEGVPLSANRGVIVHEYSHAVFNRIVSGDDRAPDPLWDPTFPAAAAAELRSLDEGLADTFAALALQDSNFISTSISEEVFQIDRDLAVKRIWNGQLQDDIDGSSAENPYLLGSVIAAALWATRDFLDDEMVAEVTLGAMRAISVPGHDFELAQFFNAWLAELSAGDAEKACEIFVERLEIIADELDCG